MSGFDMFLRLGAEPVKLPEEVWPNDQAEPRRDVMSHELQAEDLEKLEVVFPDHAVRGTSPLVDLKPRTTSVATTFGGARAGGKTNLVRQLLDSRFHEAEQELKRRVADALSVELEHKILTGEDGFNERCVTTFDEFNDVSSKVLRYVEKRLGGE